MAILLATTAASASASSAASTIIVQAGIAPAIAGAVMVVNDVRRWLLQSVTAVAAVSSAAPLPHRPKAPQPATAATAVTIVVTAAVAQGQAAAQFPPSSALMFFDTVDCCFF